MLLARITFNFSMCMGRNVANGTAGICNYNLLSVRNILIIDLDYVYMHIITQILSYFSANYRRAHIQKTSFQSMAVFASTLQGFPK